MATAVLGGAAPFASVKFCGRVEPGAQRDSRRYRKRESALRVGSDFVNSSPMVRMFLLASSDTSPLKPSTFRPVNSDTSIKGQTIGVTPSAISPFQSPLLNGLSFSASFGRGEGGADEAAAGGGAVSGFAIGPRPGIEAYPSNLGTRSGSLLFGVPFGNLKSNTLTPNRLSPL
jgi:hypothetical protein